MQGFLCDFRASFRKRARLLLTTVFPTLCWSAETSRVFSTLPNRFDAIYHSMRWPLFKLAPRSGDKRWQYKLRALRAARACYVRHGFRMPARMALR